MHRPSHTRHPRRHSRYVRTLVLSGALGLAWVTIGDDGSVSASGRDDRAGISDEVFDWLRDHPPVAAVELDVEVDEDAWRDDVLAWHGDIAVHRPAASTVVVGFHESGAASAVPVVPDASPDEQFGRQEVLSASRRADEDLTTLVMPSRGRAAGPSTAMDIAVAPDEVVHAPVTGTVTKVVPYALYGRVDDLMLVLEPEDRPDLRLHVLHVDSPLVQVGDRVEAGRTPLAARARALPFPSQIDPVTEAEVGTATPHVHLELRRHDPNAGARGTP